MISGEVRRPLVKLLGAAGAVALVVGLASVGWQFERACDRSRALDAAARAYVDWIRAGDPRAGIELGAERRFAHALGLRGAALERDGGSGDALRGALAARLQGAGLQPPFDPAPLLLDDASWRCDRANDCTRRDARHLAQALQRLDRALAIRRAKLHLSGEPLALDGAPAVPLARPVPIRGSRLIASWLGTNAWGQLLRSRPLHTLDFPDGHHLALQAHDGGIWATTWSDATARRGPERIAQVPSVECGPEEPLASDRAPARCREVAITAMVATRGGRVAVKLLRTDVDSVSELLLASADYGRSWQPGRAQAIR
jgi:hypothetical protein